MLARETAHLPAMARAFSCPGVAKTSLRWPPLQAYQVWCPHAAFHMQVGTQVVRASSIAAPALEPQGPLPIGAVEGNAPLHHRSSGRRSGSSVATGQGRPHHAAEQKPISTPLNAPCENTVVGASTPCTTPFGSTSQHATALVNNNNNRSSSNDSGNTVPRPSVASGSCGSSTRSISRTMPAGNSAPSLPIRSNRPRSDGIPLDHNYNSSRSSAANRSRSNSNSSSSTPQNTNRSARTPNPSIRPPKAATATTTASPPPASTTNPTPVAANASSPAPRPSSSSRPPRRSSSSASSPQPPLSLELLRHRTPALQDLEPALLRTRLLDLSQLLHVKEAAALELCKGVPGLLLARPHELSRSMQRLRYALRLAPPPASRTAAAVAPPQGEVAAAAGVTAAMEAAPAPGTASLPAASGVREGAGTGTASGIVGGAAAGATSKDVEAQRAAARRAPQAAPAPGTPTAAAGANVVQEESGDGDSRLAAEGPDAVLRRICLDAPLLLLLPISRVQECLAVLSSATALPPRRAVAFLRQQPHLATLAPATLAAKLDVLKYILTCYGGIGNSSAAAAPPAGAPAATGVVGITAAAASAAAATLASAILRAPVLLTFSTAVLQRHHEQLLPLLGPQRLAAVLHAEPGVLALQPARLATKLRLLQELLGCAQHPAAVALLVARQPGLLRRSLHALSRGCRALSIWAIPQRAKLRMLLSRPGLLLLPWQEVHGRCRWLRRLMLANQYYHGALRRVPPSVLAALVAALPGAWARLQYLVESQQEGAVPLQEVMEGGQAAFDERFPAFRRWLGYKVNQMGADNPWRGTHRIRGIGTPAAAAGGQGGRVNKRNLVRMRQQQQQQKREQAALRLPGALDQPSDGPTVPVVLTEACEVRSGGSTVNRPRRVVQQPAVTVTATTASDEADEATPSSITTPTNDEPLTHTSAAATAAVATVVVLPPPYPPNPQCRLPVSSPAATVTAAVPTTAVVALVHDRSASGHHAPLRGAPTAAAASSSPAAPQLLPGAAAAAAAAPAPRPPGRGCPTGSRGGCLEACGCGGSSSSSRGGGCC
ncbi:hypothetical protein Agub_g1430 [Astrephomene gubernaculifera]|uniref:Uncharacterized protein n=1 Tax=Astrephomene gubernaculifera TaxID=47775 RepID=A0AAD3DFD8_9CHLO|nr:hypothetical protein Agub_g1430 [Astrephomene gubernaculifera]